MRALRAKDVIAACAEWCDLEVADLTDTGYLSPLVVRSRRLACLVLYADHRSHNEIARIIGYANRGSVWHLIDSASGEDILDAKKIETALRVGGS